MVWSTWDIALRDGAVAGLLGDEAVHLLRDLAVGGVARRHRAQLDEVHRLARVHLHREPDPVRERHRVRRLLGEPVDERVVERRRAAHGVVELGAEPGFVDRFGDVVTVQRAQRLPLDREHPVALQVAERAVVGDDVEAVVDAFERAPGAVTTVVALPHVRAEQLAALAVAERAHARQDLIVGQLRVRVADGGEELVFGVGIEVGEGDRRARLGLGGAEEPVDELGGVVAPLRRGTRSTRRPDRAGRPGRRTTG